MGGIVPRFAAGAGLAAGQSLDDIALDAALAALAASGVDRADLALVFTSGDTLGSAHAILHAVRRATGARAVVGCSGVGVLTGEREIEGEPAAAVLTVRSEGVVVTPFHVGQTIQFQIRDAEAAHADLEAMLDGVHARLAGRAPAFGCYFNCAGRGRGLFGEPDHDVALIRRRLGQFPLAGFFGNGEFAPVGGRNFFHTYTGVLAIFPA